MPGKKQGVPPKRSLVFAFFTGEEDRMLGSRYFTAHPPVDLKSVVANLNLDVIHTILPLQAIVLTVSTSRTWVTRHAGRAASQHVPIEDESLLHAGEFTCCSDQRNFVEHGIPALLAKVGFPGELSAKLQQYRRDVYHTPADNLQQPIDLNTAAKFEEIMLRLLLDVANDPHRPQWKPNSSYRRYAER
jgi:Zn-dependent M28 family amino/carboxypeptidase